jgi:UDP-2-acetamido-3-amino-2,3-dideoxy-glucuronate N-acetyltransferase
MEFFEGRARLVDFPVQTESRGSLTPFSFARLPVPPRHAFIVRSVPAGTTRGRHALKNTQQLLICLAGQVSVELREAARSETVVLDRPAIGLFIAEQLWAAQTYLTAETILLVLASAPYDPDNYVDEPPD